mgnify:CR=1 FL=1
MTWVDTLLVFSIVFFLIILVWAKVMNQSIYDTVMEIIDILKKIFSGGTSD